MSDRLERGQVVRVVMTQNNIFPWQTEPAFSAIYISGPCGPSDTFSLDVAGTRLQLNGNSTDFIGMYREEASDE
jgi:hypothetical protein